MCDSNCKQCKFKRPRYFLACMASNLFGIVYCIMCIFFLHVLLYNWMYSHGNKSLMVFFWMISIFTIPLCVIQFAQAFGVVTTKSEIGGCIE